jgi:hypothetical protein
MASTTGWTRIDVTPGNSPYTPSDGESLWLDGSTGSVTVTLPPPSQSTNVRVIGVDDTNTLTLSDNAGERITINTTEKSSWGVLEGDRITVESDGVTWRAVP